MGAVLASIGTAILTSITTFLSNKALKIGTSIGILTLLFVLLPFPIGMTEEIYMLFIDGRINQFFKSVSYFLPLHFIFTCLILVLMTKYLKFYVDIIKFLWDKVVK